jgi:hypothetical protein
LPENDKWPEDVEGIKFTDTSRLGVDPKNQLYWDGKKIVTESKLTLGSKELIVAMFVAFLVLISTLLGIWQWFCELQWLCDIVCPQLK